MTIGAAVIVGPSGSGKSILCRAVVASLADGFSIADFRDTTPDEAFERLNALFARVGVLPSSTVILEDLNDLDNARVALGRDGTRSGCFAPTLSQRLDNVLSEAVHRDADSSRSGSRLRGRLPLFFGSRSSHAREHVRRRSGNVGTPRILFGS